MKKYEKIKSKLSTIKPTTTKQTAIFGQTSNFLKQNNEERGYVNLYKYISIGTGLR